MTREQYHQKRINKAVAKVCQNFYDNFGDEDQWPEWVFEEEAHVIEKVKERICQEDGFTNG